MSNLERLEAAVRKGQEMRAAQIAFFKDRDRDVLAKSKRLEKEFDRLAAEALRQDDLLGG